MFFRKKIGWQISEGHHTKSPTFNSVVRRIGNANSTGAPVLVSMSRFRICLTNILGNSLGHVSKNVLGHIRGDILGNIFGIFLEMLLKLFLKIFFWKYSRKYSWSIGNAPDCTRVSCSKHLKGLCVPKQRCNNSDAELEMRANG